MSIIKKWSYYNEKPNAIAIKIKDFITLYFSYDTVIAFEHKNILYISKNEFKNDWGNTSRTTGKHLKAIRILDIVSNRDDIIEKSHKDLMDLLNEIINNLT